MTTIHAELNSCPLCNQDVENIEPTVKNGVLMKLKIRCNACHTTFEIEPDYYKDEAGRIYLLDSPADIWNRKNWSERDMATAELLEEDIHD